ncbi:hypothetical protein NDU88_000331 [Pleurodeles waltl]|uniref:Uncharacterized protein n=1 Tax=Pleurodeles waltl TaxID=8319 RepID=A0AAV7VX38_PLEWA|nr:hypothetical protein NDU88_000331 [Pleurodeles waltl]
MKPESEIDPKVESEIDPKVKLIQKPINVLQVSAIPRSSNECTLSLAREPQRLFQSSLPLASAPYCKCGARFFNRFPHRLTGFSVFSGERFRFVCCVVPKGRGFQSPSPGLA